MNSVINASELERIKSSVQIPLQSDGEAKRIYLKELSQKRTEKWPNTLEATRKKKDSWKKDKDELEENKRKIIDEQENLFQKESRLRQIERANQLLYEQTDKMKTLRSKMLLADVMEERDIQIEEKKQIQKIRLEKERRWEMTLKQQLIDAENKEMEKKIFLHEKEKKMAQDQKQQLEEFKQAYFKHIQEDKLEGIKLLNRAKQDIQEDQEKEREVRRQAKLASEETKLADERLQQLRQKEKEKEDKEDLKREEEIKKKLEILEKRAQIQKGKLEQISNQKNRMIERATNHLLQSENNSDQRIENQRREALEKQDKELKERMDRRERQQQEINRSRTLQLQQRQEKQKQNIQQSKEEAERWNTHCNQLEGKEKAAERERIEENKRIADSLKLQAEERHQSKMEERVMNLLAEKASQFKIDEENILFQKMAQASLEEAISNGKKHIYPIKAAATTKEINLLPAGGSRV